MTWDEKPADWDTIYIDGMPMIGIWEVEPVNGTVRNVKARRSKGKDGAKLKDHGLEEAHLKLTGRITSKMWEVAKADIERLLSPVEGAEQAPHTISHPMCDAMRIDKIVIRGVKPCPPERGLMKIEVSATKWIKETSDAKTTDKFNSAVTGDQYEKIADKYDPPATRAVDEYLAGTGPSPFLDQSN